jgi:hypothetical protein
MPFELVEMHYAAAMPDGGANAEAAAVEHGSAKSKFIGIQDRHHIS